MTIRFGNPEVRQDTPAHTPGIREGNELGAYARQAGHRPDGRSTARRSTGVSAKDREPIDPRMPNLSPG
ncbi:MAG TPA: hypothetical protein VN635_11845 [Conexibacter sp.]|nr:hypothetical protein [Conexibacter sp.]